MPPPAASARRGRPLAHPGFHTYGAPLLALALTAAGARATDAAGGSLCTPLTSVTAVCGEGECYDAAACGCARDGRHAACAVDVCAATPCPAGTRCVPNACGGCAYHCERRVPGGGAVAVPQEPMAYDCTWRVGTTPQPWTSMQREECCRREGVRCPSAPPARAAPSYATCRQLQSHPDCCRVHGLACRYALPYDCTATPFTYAEAHARWCCRERNVCPVVCLPALLGGLSNEERLGCCDVNGVCAVGPVASAGGREGPVADAASGVVDITHAAPLTMTFAGGGLTVNAVLANPRHVLLRVRRAALAAAGGALRPEHLIVTSVGVLLPDGTVPHERDTTAWRAWTRPFTSVVNRVAWTEERRLFAYISDAYYHSGGPAVDADAGGPAVPTPDAAEPADAPPSPPHELFWQGWIVGDGHNATVRAAAAATTAAAVIRGCRADDGVGRNEFTLAMAPVGNADAHGGDGVTAAAAAAIAVSLAVVGAVAVATAWRVHASGGCCSCRGAAGGAGQDDTHERDLDLLKSGGECRSCREGSSSSSTGSDGSGTTHSGSSRSRSGSRATSRSGTLAGASAALPPAEARPVLRQGDGLVDGVCIDLTRTLSLIDYEHHTTREAKRPGPMHTTSRLG